MRQYLADYKNIARLAFPVVLSNAVDTVMMMIDRLFLSRFGHAAEIALGGSMGGAVITWLAQAPILGLLLYSNAMAAQNFGRAQLPRCAQTVTQAMYWVLLYYPLMLGLSRFIPAILKFMQHDPALAAAEWSYARILIAGSIFFLLRLPLNSFFIASNRSSLVMKVSFAGIFLNIPLNYWFIFDVPLRLGAWNLQPSNWGIGNGIAGAATATVVAQCFTCSLLLLLFLRQKRAYRVAEAWRLRPDIHYELLRYGLPASLEGCLTSFSFNIFLMLFYSISPTVAAAATITFSWDLCNFIVLLGIGTATTTLVGQSLGANNLAQARRYTQLILFAALVFSGFISLWFLLAPDLLSSLFITESAQAQQSLLQLSRTMLRLATIYLLADALGTVMRGALMGAGDTVAVMLISACLHLLLLGGSIVLLKVYGLGAIEFWSSFVVFSLFSNSALAMRYKLGNWCKRWQKIIAPPQHATEPKSRPI